MAHQLLLDTSSLAYRAFFALPTSIKDPQGRPVNALRGYLDMTARLVSDHGPDEVVHTFDHDWRPAPRVEAYAGYKANRLDQEEPEELTGQFEVLREVLDAFGQTRVAQASAGDVVEVVTGDRDLLQLVDDGADGAVVRVLFTVRGVSELGRFDAAAVQDKYGITPGQYVEFATLRGDPSDGLPGVKGIGEKTARDLLRTYGSLPQVLANIDDLTPRLHGALVDSRDYLLAMADVVPVRCDVELTVVRQPPDDERLTELAERHAIEAPVGRLREALGA
jgi:5'-3' exonuclease